MRRLISPIIIVGILILFTVQALSMFRSMEPVRAPEVGVFYTNLEKVCEELSVGEMLSVESFRADGYVRPHQVVCCDGMIYCLGQSIDGVNWLYSFDPGNGQWIQLMSDADVPNKSPESFWNDLQCVGGLLIWDQYEGKDDHVSDKRFCLNPVTGEEGAAAFRHGKIYEWNGKFYKFESKFHSNLVDLVALNQSGKEKIVAKDLFRYQDSEMILDGMIGYLQGGGDWAFRYSMDEDKTADKLLIEGSRAPVIQSTADYMVCLEHDGRIFVYFYETGKTYCIRQADEDIPQKVKVELRNNGVWVIHNKKISLITLPDLQLRTVETIGFTDYYITEEGVLILCDRGGNRISVCEGNVR